MNTYDVSVIKQQYGFMTIEAESEGEARKKAKKALEDGLDFECNNEGYHVGLVQKIFKNNF